MKRYFSLLLCAVLCVGCLALTGCGIATAPPTETQAPTTTAPGQGLVQAFQRGDLRLEITNVASTEERSGLDHGTDPYDYTVFTLYPGAQLRVIGADMNDGGDTEAGVPYAKWYVSAENGGEYIPITDDMPPLTITSDMGGVFQEGPAVLVFKWFA